ncbi:MAG: glucoamylase family protein [Bacteroidales bacterium]
MEKIRSGNIDITLQGPNFNVPLDSAIVIKFNASLDTVTVRKSLILSRSGSTLVPFGMTYLSGNQTIVLTPINYLDPLTNYVLQISSSLSGIEGQTFTAASYSFTTNKAELTLKSATLNGKEFLQHKNLTNIDYNHVDIELGFSDALDSSSYKTFFTLGGSNALSFSLSDSSRKVSITNNTVLPDYTLTYFSISTNLRSKKGLVFNGFINSFYTILDSTYKFPALSDNALLDLVQQQTLKYFVDFAHPACGMARERNTSGDVVTMGGSGFGIMGMVAGMNRGFITRDQGLTQFGKILTFLETCDRFHGAWPHWLNGNTGKVVPFGPKDDGGDIVETSYMVMGLYTMRQYLDSTNTAEKQMIDSINSLTSAIDYNWYTQGQNVLYWNWSPDYGFAINVKVQGYNETLITYVIAASSTTHPISAAAYHQGYAQNGAIVNGQSYYGITLPLGQAYGGPLFFTQYTYLGLDPRNLSDMYANYWTQNVNQSMINYSYCVANPKKYIGYNSTSWGLTASDEPAGYSAHSPTNDDGVLTPTAAVSSLPYTPVQSMDAIRKFYYILGNRLWGQYGYYDAYDPTESWWASSYLAIDEGPIIGMIENYRSQLLWNLFMSCPEIQQGLTKLGFTY